MSEYWRDDDDLSSELWTEEEADPPINAYGLRESYGDILDETRYGRVGTSDLTDLEGVWKRYR